ncbi:imidazole glycerol phosphate synthase subunit HisH [Methanosphaera sp.]
MVIVDYGSGNLRSIYNAFKRIGEDVVVSSDTAVLADADALVIPGVGAFGVAMSNLSGFVDVIAGHVDCGKPLLGICLGLQLLFESSEETPGVNGLGFFEGSCKRFDLDSSFKIPHMGWNQIRVNDTSRNNVSILEGADNKYMYFVHSYYVDPVCRDFVTAYCDYGMDVPVAVGRDNLFALQFHPEKSGKVGLGILSNFVDLI